jgi:uncharacterized membrane protein (UPF0127 family)
MDGIDAPIPPLRIRRATRFWQRFFGLMGRRALDRDAGLLLVPCGSVHTAGMRFAIDVVFLDREGVVLRTVPHLRPWRAAACRGAHGALELCAGEALRRGFGVGQRLPAGIGEAS